MAESHRDPAALLALADRLERAEGPSRELDARVEWMLGRWPADTSAYANHYEGFVRHCSSPAEYQDSETGEKYVGVEGDFFYMPEYSTSLDACRALHERLLPGWSADLRLDGLACQAEVIADTMSARCFRAEARTLELAWCSALCRALAAGLTRREPWT